MQVIRRDLTLVFILFGSIVLAQKNKIDSLKQVIADATNDTTRVSAYLMLSDACDAVDIETYAQKANNICNNFFNKNNSSHPLWKHYLKKSALALNNLAIASQNRGDLQTAIEFIGKSLKINEQINDQKGIALSLYNLGSCYLTQGKVSRGMAYTLKSLKIREDIKDRKGIAESLTDLGYMKEQIGEVDAAIEYFQRSLKVREQINDQIGIGQMLNNLGFIYYSMGNLEKAEEFYNKALMVSEDINDEANVARVLNSLGAICDTQGEIRKAIDYYSQALKLSEKANAKDGIAASLNNLGFTYQQQGDFPRAVEFYLRGVKIWGEMNDKSGLAPTLTNLGSIYLKQGDVTKANDFYSKAMIINEELSNKDGIAQSLTGMGDVYSYEGKIEEAIKYYNKSLGIYEEMRSEGNIASNLNALAKAHVKLGKWQLAKDLAERGFKLSKKIGHLAIIKETSLVLSKIYAHFNNYKDAYEMQLVYKQMSDSVSNEANKKAALKQAFQYEYGKKAVADSVKRVEELRVHAVELDQEKTQRYSLYGGLALVALFGIFIFSRYRVTQKQKTIIEIKEKETSEQKVVIEEKHKEITDSINYAERIQRSFLATKEHLNRNLKEYFVLYKPKDVVSGDFYWSATLENGKFILATADSTGHGVPGAIMSLLNITSLEKAIEHHNSPDEILNATRQTIIQRLKNDGSMEGGKDGMDCSLCVYDFENMKLNIASSNNPVWIMRSSKNETSENSLSGSGLEVEIIEIKPDKIPVGKHDKQNTAFTLHSVELKKGDIIYTLTDGLPDQFGGLKGKKFMIKNLRQLLANNCHLSMPDQMKLLETTFSKWVGDLEQIDDVTVIGVRV